jgi:hypothetical protein
MGRRVDAFIRIMRLSGVPLQKGDHPNRYALQGIPGFAFRFAGRGLFSNGHGQPNVNVQRMLAILAREGMPVTIQHHAGSPYDEAIVSMYARDWARLMVAFIDTDPERYSIQRKGSQA